jgi:hypothetical protein
VTDALKEIDDDELKRRIVQAEQLLDRLYGEKQRRQRKPDTKEPSHKNYHGG